MSPFIARLLFALSRWGGLRVGSEVRRLTWDIDWQRQRFTVRSPKTEHHQGGGSRSIPIFPELAKLLDERFAEADEGETLVLPMLVRCTDTALRQLLVRAIVRAGVEPWPRPWHNMRATRQTELADRFPGHVVCSWLGNSETTAIKHYLRVRDDHFDKAAQNAAQSVHESPRRALQANWADSPKPLEKQSHATTRNVVHKCSVVREGLEPPTKEL